jgi:hypothetical protein
LRAGRGEVSPTALGLLCWCHTATTSTGLEQLMATQTRGVFVSYRRQDSAFSAGWLYDQLVLRFGEPHVFKDVDSIEPGEDFVNAITAAVRSCHTLLVVIGPTWLSAPDKFGNRRIDGRDDYVRL